MMNLIFGIVLLAIVAFSALHVQGSMLLLYPAVYVYENSCIISHFGETHSLSDLGKIVFESPLEKVVDAFIACPKEMCEVYHEKLKSYLYRDLDDLVIFVRDSGKISQFYSAIRSFAPEKCSGYSDITGVGLYFVSFIYDIPREYYFDELKKNEENYLWAVLEKATLVKTAESKKEITEMLNDIYKNASKTRASLNLKNDPILNHIRLTIKLMNNEDDLIEDFKSNEKWQIVLLALSFNRCDLAEIATQDLSSIDLNIAKGFLYERAFEGIEDKERAIEIVKKLLPNKKVRSAFNKFLNSRAANQTTVKLMCCNIS